jgi:hypothetical protein
VRTQRRLGRLGQYDDPIAGYLSVPQGPTASQISEYLWPTAGGSLASGTAQIQSVPANAAAANLAAGTPVYNVAAIQAAADLQPANFVANNQTIWSTPVAFSLTDPTTWPWYMWVGIIGGGYLLLDK